MERDAPNSTSGKSSNEPDDTSSTEVSDGKADNATERDGILSHAGEWHALTIGIYRGLSTYRPWSDDYEEVADQYDDVAKKPWYYKGGYVLGTFFQVIFVLIVIYAWAWWSP